jgi:Rod binding domain-containing protein
MTAIRPTLPSDGPGVPKLDAAHEKLRKAAHQLEGVFMSQLFRAMRATVNETQTGPGTEGRELFTSMLDDKIAELAASRMKRGLGDALYRQMAGKLSAVQPSAPVDGQQPSIAKLR